MAIETLDWTWLDAQRHVEQAELEHMCSLTSAEIDELVEYGALVPVITETTVVRQFSAGCVAPLREATRLRADYDLDLFTVSLLFGYLQRISDLEQQLHALQAHLPRSA